MSKLEYDQRQYKISLSQLLEKYKKENIFYESILKSHNEQESCIALAKRLLPKTQFILTHQLKKTNTYDKDLIISIGGDEHFKYVVHNSIRDHYFLNICSDNHKSEGVLSTCNRHNLDSMIHQIQNQAYIIEYWTNLNTCLNGNLLEVALDTIYIGVKQATSISRYNITHQGKTEEQKSSGILVATGAGSSGWFLSAGASHSFPPTEPKAQFLVREVYKGTKTGGTLTTGDITFKTSLTVHSLMDHYGLLNIDSIKDYPFTRGSKLKITLAPKPLKILLLNHSIL